MRKGLLFLSTLVFSVLFNTKVFAIWPDFTPVIPVAPQFCAQCIAADIPLVLGYVEQAKAMVDKYKSYLNTSFWKQKFAAYAMKMGETAFNSLVKKIGKKERFLSYSRTIKKCKVADLSKKSDVREAFIKLFLQYPSTKPSKMAEYEAMGKQFQIDTTIEAIATGKLMSKEVETMKADLLKMEGCLMKGEKCAEVGLQDCSASDSEDNSCMWNNATRAALLYDKIMRDNEYIISMMSQYEAVQGINRYAKIRLYTKKKKSKKTSSLSNQYNRILPQKFYAEAQSMAAFADTTADEDFNEYINSLNSRENTIPEDFDEYKPATGFETALDGKDDDLEGQNALTEVQENVDSAKDLHNLKQNMPGYRRVFEAYHNMEDYYNKALDNFSKSTICAIDMLTPHYNDAVRAWTGKSCRFHGGKRDIECKYTETNTADESKGMYDVSCADNPTEKCYVAKLTNTDERAGISGYLLDMYDTAKEQDATADVDSVLVASEEKKDDNAYITVKNVEIVENEDKNAKPASLVSDSTLYVTEKDGDGDGSVPSIKNLKNQVGGKSSNDVTAASKLKDPSLEDALTAENRKNDLLPWQIGATVVSEVEKDLHSGSEHFGKVNQPFPLWKDQQVFYDQYIQGKYDNILHYIDNEPFAEETLKLAEAINKVKKYEPLRGPTGVIIKSMEVLRSEYANGIKTAKEYFAAAGNPSDQIDAILRSNDAALDSKISGYKSKIDALYNQKKELESLLKNANEKLSEARDTYNRSNDEMLSSDMTSARAEDAKDYSENLYANRKLSTQSPQDKSFGDTQAKNEILKAAAVNNKATAEASMKALEARVTELENALKKNKEDINNARSEYVKEYSLAEIAAKRSVKEKKEDLYNSALMAHMNEVASGNPAIKAAKVLVDCVRQYAKTQVQGAVGGIDALKTNNKLYYHSNEKLVQDIHNGMIDKITNISEEKLNSEAGLQCKVVTTVGELIETADLENDVSPAVQAVYDIFKNICTDGYCKKADAEYFVSILGKKRDFTSPKGAVDFASAPIREVFHFDVIDYGKVDKYVWDKKELWSNKNITITAESFLNSGLDIPEIWRYILARHSYVERDMDLADLFGNPNDKMAQAVSNREFLRGGTYPCVLGTTYVDVVKGVKSFGYKTEGSGNVPACQEVVLNGNKVVDAKSLAAPKHVNAETNITSSPERISELSTILAYIPNETEKESKVTDFFGIHAPVKDMKLSFNAALQNAMQIVNDNTSLGDNAQDDALFYMSQRAFLDRNQFGDYLNQYEILSVTKKSMQELEEQMAEIRETLMTAVEGTGFSVSDGIDLSRKDDYDSMANILKKQKTYYVNLSKQGLGNIHVKTSTLKQTVEKVQHTIAVLEKDNREIVAVSGDEDLDELADTIKNKEADNSVANEYGKAEEEGKTDLKELMPAYCSSYNN